jgi:hypothetical protein
MCVNLCVEAAYWNIKGWGHFVVRFCVNPCCLRSLQRAVSSTRWHHFDTATER